MRRFGVFAAVFVVGAAGLRCSTFSEETTDTPLEAGGTETSTPGDDASGIVEGSAQDACNADTSTDPKNCGKCGHDCLGGKCRDGECESLVLAGGLTSPGVLALAPGRVFFDVAGSGTTRDIVACDLPACAGGPEVVVSGVPTVRSLLFHDGLLLFFTHDQTSASNVIEECNPADALTCTNTRRQIEPLVPNTFDAYTPMRRGADGVYWAYSFGGTATLRRIAFTPDASPQSVTALGCPTKRVSTAANEVVWACLGGELRTCALPCAVDGGTPVADAGAVSEIERGQRVVIEDEASGNLTVLDTPLRRLPARGRGPFAVVLDALVYQDGLKNEIVECALPACVSRTRLANATATKLDADLRMVVWTNAADGTVRLVAR